MMCWIDVAQPPRATPPCAPDAGTQRTTSAGAEFDFVVLIKSFRFGACKLGALVIALGTF
jgi:hypothetical protein